jgi:hypothetical protein
MPVVIIIIIIITPTSSQRRASVSPQIEMLFFFSVGEREFPFFLLCQRQKMMRLNGASHLFENGTKEKNNKESVSPELSKRGKKKKKKGDGTNNFLLDNFSFQMMI